MPLFTAEYRDGFVYLQSADDASVQEPGKNAWFDIRYKPIRPERDLVRFTLRFESGELALNLNDGKLTVRSYPPEPGAVAQEAHQYLANGPVRGTLVYRKRNIAGFGNQPFHRRVHVLGIVTPCGEEKTMEVME